MQILPDTTDLAARAIRYHRSRVADLVIVVPSTFGFSMTDATLTLTLHAMDRRISYVIVGNILPPKLFFSTWKWLESSLSLLRMLNCNDAWAISYREWRVYGAMREMIMSGNSR